MKNCSGTAGKRTQVSGLPVQFANHYAKFTLLTSHVILMVPTLPPPPPTFFGGLVGLSPGITVSPGTKKYVS